MQIGLTVGFVLWLSVAPCFAEDPDQRNLESFDLVWETVNREHFDPTFGGLDWRARYARYRPQIVRSRGLEAFKRITNRMLFELGLSHLLVATDNMLKAYMPTLFAAGSTGLEVRWMGNQAIVTRVASGSPAHTAGLRPGYEITRIAGWEVADLVHQADALPPYNPRNRNGGLANYLKGQIDGPPGTTVAIAYRNADVTPKQALLLRRPRGPGRIISEAMPPVHIHFEARRLADNIGYIRFNHFAAPVDQQFADALETLRDTRGLIFDLRGNPGGYFRIMDTIVTQLIRAETLLYRFRFRDRTVTRVLRPARFVYLKPVAILIDATSTSCSEHFAACLQAIGRAVIVGAQSPGYLLGAQWKRLPNGLSFMHTFLQPIPSDGRIVEGQGVKPDIAIELDRQRLLAGEDNQLEAARTYIRTHPAS